MPSPEERRKPRGNAHKRPLPRIENVAAFYLWVDDDNRAIFKEAESSPPNYEKQGQTIDLAFWRAPERLVDEPDELVLWAREALATGRRVAAKRTPKRRRVGGAR